MMGKSETVSVIGGVAGHRWGGDAKKTPKTINYRKKKE